MTADEFASIRVELGLTRTELAQVLDVTPRTIQAWELDTHEVSGAARVLMRLLRRRPHRLSEIREAAGVGNR